MPYLTFDGAQYVLDGQPLANWDWIEVADGETWRRGTFFWNGEKGDRPWILSGGLGTALLENCKVRRDTSLWTDAAAPPTPEPHFRTEAERRAQR
jgi:hypothetical protein